jgi:hypothetical protein
MSSESALDLLDWRPSAAEQLPAVHQVRVLLGIHKARNQAATELAGPTAW